MQKRLHKFGFVHVIDGQGKKRLFSALATKESSHFRYECCYRPVPGKTLATILSLFYTKEVTHAIAKDQNPPVLTKALLRKYRKSQTLLHTDLPPMKLVIAPKMIGVSNFTEQHIHTELSIVRDVGQQLGLSFTASKGLSPEKLYLEASFDSCIRFVDEIVARQIRTLDISFVDCAGLSYIRDAAFDMLSKATEFVPADEQVVSAPMQIQRIEFQSQYNKKLFWFTQEWGENVRAYLTHDPGLFTLRSWFPAYFEKISDSEIVSTISGYMKRTAEIYDAPGITRKLKCTLAEGSRFETQHQSLLELYGQKIEENSYIFEICHDTPQGVIFALERECMKMPFLVI